MEDIREIFCHHFDGERLYLTRGKFIDDPERGHAKELAVIKFSDLEDYSGVRRNFEEVRSVVLHDSAEVVFDHERENVRIFVHTKVGGDSGDGGRAEGGGQAPETRSTLTIYGHDFEKLSVIDLAGFEIKIDSKQEFRIIDGDKIFMRIKRVADGRFMSFILNIEDKSLTELVYLEGRSSGSEFLGWTGERLIVSGDYDLDSDGKNLGKIFFSGKI